MSNLSDHLKSSPLAQRRSQSQSLPMLTIITKLASPLLVAQKYWKVGRPGITPGHCPECHFCQAWHPLPRPGDILSCTDRRLPRKTFRCVKKADGWCVVCRKAPWCYERLPVGRLNLEACHNGIGLGMKATERAVGLPARKPGIGPALPNMPPAPSVAPANHVAMAGRFTTMG